MNVVMLNVIILNVIMLNVIMLNVITPNILLSTTAQYCPCISNMKGLYEIKTYADPVHPL
jgi:hypothetical protein